MFLLQVRRGPAHRLHTWEMCVYIQSRIPANVQEHKLNMSTQNVFNAHVEWYARLSPYVAVRIGLCGLCGLCGCENRQFPE